MPSKLRLRFSSSLLGAFLLALASACGDGSGSAATDGGLRDGGPNSAPVVGKDACYAAARATDAGLSDEAKCVCDTCLDEITTCNEDEGCSEIRACMQRTSCTATNCYVGKGLCRAVIDKWNAMSLSFALSQRIGECASAMSCHTQGPTFCSSVATFECDGNEDCGPSGMCCARFNGATYDQSICADSCDTLTKANTDKGVLWSELCHPGATCETEGYSCLASDLLPSFLYRCRDTGTAPPDGGVPNVHANAVICGNGACGKGEKCCVRAPKAPYCALTDEDCACSPSVVRDSGVAGQSGGDDAGSMGDDAG